MRHLKPKMTIERCHELLRFENVHREAWHDAVKFLLNLVDAPGGWMPAAHPPAKKVLVEIVYAPEGLPHWPTDRFYRTYGFIDNDGQWVEHPSTSPDIIGDLGAFECPVYWWRHLPSLPEKAYGEHSDGAAVAASPEVAADGRGVAGEPSSQPATDVSVGAAQQHPEGDGAAALQRPGVRAAARRPAALPVDFPGKGNNER